MNLILVSQAADEFEDAVARYEDKQAGLGRRFRDEVDQHMRWIMGHAGVPRSRPGGYRRVNLKVFPHYISYVASDTIWILAIAHGNREPEYWINRNRGTDRAGNPEDRPPGRLKSPNQITGANADGPRPLPIRTPWAARIAQFWRWA